MQRSQGAKLSGTTVACGVAPANGTSYSYNGDGLRVASAATTTSGSTITTATTASTWDLMSGGGVPLNINDAGRTAQPGTTTNTSYVYGSLLFGGTAPIEQISDSSDQGLLVTNPTGVQGVYGSTGASLEQAIYTLYGVQASRREPG